MRRPAGSNSFGSLALALAFTIATLPWAGASRAAEEVPSAVPVVSEEEIEKVDPRSTDVESIKITSRKREEDQQKTPVSVTAFTATNLGEFHISDASGVADLTPNLMINRTSSGSTAYMTCMRGMCRTDSTITDDPYVGIYLNGVYTGKAMGSIIEVADIERIEINRGPQGTLFGKNTIGGAVNVVSVKPSGEAGVDFNFLGGSYGTTNFKAVVDVPEMAGFSTKLAYLTKNHDAYVDNAFNGGDSTDLQDESKQAILADILWEPFDNFSADFIVDYSRVREAPWAVFLTETTGGYVGGGVVIDSFSDWIDSYEEGEGAKNEADAQGYTMTLDWSLGDLGFVHGAGLKSITSHRRYWNDYNVNSSAFNAYRNLWTQDRFSTENTSQELQFSGTAVDDRLTILAGFFYLREEGDYTNHQGFMAPAPLPAGTYFDMITRTGIEYDSYALFTEETFAITDEFKVSAGVRWTYEDREGDHSFESINGDGFAPPGTGFGQLVYWSTDAGVDNLGSPTDTTFTSSTWSPRVTLSYDINPDLMVFGGWTRGFKSGGFNARSITAPLWNPYDDQEVDSFELGFKSGFWDRRARLNVTAFYALNKDAQIQFNRVTASGWEVLLANAGDADIYGAEVEYVLRPVEGLELRGGLGITSYEYSEVINPWTGVDEKDTRHLEFSPKYNWNISGRYIFPSLGFATASARIDYVGYSDIGFNTSIPDDYVVGQSPYGLVHLRLALDDITVGDMPGAIGVAFVGKNLTDTSYRVGGYRANVAGFGSYSANVYGDPRFFGGEISYRWGSGI